MIFTISIKNHNDTLILNDLFHMDSVSELLKNFSSLNNKNLLLDKPSHQDFFNLQIESDEANLVNVFVTNFNLLHEIKDNIYHAIIKKYEEYNQQNVLNL